jgi:hypothetical protein
LVCPVCHAEYVSGFTRCSDCDVELVEALPPDRRARSKPADRGLFARRPLAWFMGVALVPFVVAQVLLGLGVVQYVSLATYSLVAPLAAVGIVWLEDASPRRPQHLALRIAVFVLVALAVGLLLYRLYPIGRGTGEHLRNAAPTALVLAYLTTCFWSPSSHVRELVQPLLCWRVPWQRYAFALLAVPLITLLAVEIAHLLPFVTPEHLPYPPGYVDRWLRYLPRSLLGGMIEWAPWVVAWYGFAARRLLARQSPLEVALLLGTLFGAASSLPGLAFGLTIESAILFLVSDVALAVIAVWLFESSHRSLLPVLILQGAYVASATLLSFASVRMAVSFTTGEVALDIGLCALALVLISVDKMWMRPTGGREAQRRQDLGPLAAPDA